MRAYPIDSPQAATRLLAMALVADGHYAPSELKALDRLGASERLGLSPLGMKSVIDTYCQELMQIQHGDGQGLASMPAELRNRLLGEVRNPRLRDEVRQLCEAIVLADGHLADSEVAVLDAMADAWRHQPTQAWRAVAARM
ncbi:TerB family tellurite resistance protein [Hydrogenophaga sp. PAMC20947]|uniref:TerB family tellurite resistance protein n=1 Tax=Hydrogenophaga sp. PAMC20947 TaxID=2565558 RepID=UPI00109DBC51|nr:TerB family tellurite resistance protein [Hydrogenophaga sp. PAMC20947]QCB47474.1 TerB family tellurite resistance protein [Hydrogenophaga sp. PAMC20947]